MKRCNSLLPLVMALCSLPAWAVVERLDDSASPRARVQAQTVLSDQGRPLVESGGARIALLRFGTVEYRLATTRYIGQRARIHYVIPAQIRGLVSPAGLKVDWRGMGRFASGSARPGDRTLVWSGVIREPWIVETIDLSMQLDLRQLQMAGNSDFGFESYFEIETLP